MGQVWRAHDTKLDRAVALKILPEAFVHDADRVARFTREAKTLAALNRPGTLPRPRSWHTLLSGGPESQCSGFDIT